MSLNPKERLYFSSSNYMQNTQTYVPNLFNVLINEGGAEA